MVTLGKVSEEAKPEGFGTKSPFISHLIRVPVRQLTQSLDAECYSSDLQQVNVMLRVLYRIPEGKVVEIYKNYSGDPFDSLIAPRLSALPHQKCYPTEAGDLVASCGKLCARVLGSDQARRHD